MIRNRSAAPFAWLAVALCASLASVGPPVADAAPTAAAAGSNAPAKDFPIAFDPDSKVSSMYSVQGMPSSIIVDRKGNVRVVHRGYRPGDENTYLDHIRTLLRE